MSKYAWRILAVFAGGVAMLIPLLALADFIGLDELFDQVEANNMLPPVEETYYDHDLGAWVEATVYYERRPNYPLEIQSRPITAEHVRIDGEYQGYYNDRRGLYPGMDGESYDHSYSPYQMMGVSTFVPPTFHGMPVLGYEIMRTGEAMRAPAGKPGGLTLAWQPFDDDFINSTAGRTIDIPYDPNTQKVRWVTETRHNYLKGLHKGVTEAWSEGARTFVGDVFRRGSRFIKNSILPLFVLCELCAVDELNAGSEIPTPSDLEQDVLDLGDEVDVFYEEVQDLEQDFDAYLEETYGPGSYVGGDGLIYTPATDDSGYVTTIPEFDAAIAGLDLEPMDLMEAFQYQIKQWENAFGPPTDIERAGILDNMIGFIMLSQIQLGRPLTEEEVLEIAVNYDIAAEPGEMYVPVPTDIVEPPPEGDIDVTPPDIFDETPLAPEYQYEIGPENPAYPPGQHFNPEQPLPDSPLPPLPQAIIIPPPDGIRVYPSQFDVNHPGYQGGFAHSFLQLPTYDGAPIRVGSNFEVPDLTLEISPIEIDAFEPRFGYEGAPIVIGPNFEVPELTLGITPNRVDTFEPTFSGFDFGFIWD